jgi:vitamin B12 transporter
MCHAFKRTAVAVATLSVLNTYAADSSLSEVVVTATRQPQRADEVLADVSVIERDTIEQAGAGSVIDLLARQPGVQMFQNGGPGTTAQIFLRGSRTDQVKVLIDGMPINSIDISGSPLRFIPLGDVDHIEILRGPASALYGADALGGVIQIFTRRGAAGLGGEVFVGAGSYGVQKSSASISGGDERWHFKLSGNDDRGDGLSTIRHGKGRDGDHDAYREMGANGALSFTPLQGHELSAQWMRNHGQTYFDSSTGNGTTAFNSRVDFANEVWNVSSRDKLTDAWTSTLRYGQSLDNQSSYTTSATPSIIDTRSTQTSWQNDITLPLGSALVLLERLDQHVGPRARFPSNPVDSHNDAVVLGWTAALDAHRWQLSGRHDDHSKFGSKDTWSAAYGYQLDKNWRVNGSVGTSFKAPTLYQLYAVIPAQLVANPALKPEEGRNKELGLTWEQGLQTASVTWYRNDINNLVDFNNGATQYQNISNVTLEGWTLAWNGRLDDWTLASSLDLLDARNETTHRSLERRAKQKVNAFASRDWGQWNVGAEAVAVGRRYSGTSSNSEALPMGGYTLLNLTARYPLTRNLGLELRADNITDKQYATARTSIGATAGLYDYNTPGASWFVGLRYKM